jgi:hypothetical protein
MGFTLSGTNIEVFVSQQRISPRKNIVFPNEFTFSTANFPSERWFFSLRKQVTNQHFSPENKVSLEKINKG